MANKHCILASKISLLTITHGGGSASLLRGETGASALVDHVGWPDKIAKLILFFTATSILLTACGPVRRPMIRQSEAVKKVIPIPKSWYTGKPPRPGIVAVTGTINEKSPTKEYLEKVVVVDSRKNRISSLSATAILSSQGQNAPLAPNGRWLAFTDYRNNNVGVVDIETGTRRTLIQPRRTWRVTDLNWANVSKLFVMAEKTGKSERRVQVFSINPLTGRIGAVVIDSPVRVGNAPMDTPIFPITLEVGRDWVAAYSEEGLLRWASLLGHRQVNLRINKQLNMAPAISPNGQVVAYEEGNAVWLRTISLNSVPKRVLKIRPKRDNYVIGADSYVITWPDTNKLLIVDMNRGGSEHGRYIDTTVTVSTYRLKKANLSLQSRSTVKALGEGEEWDEFDKQYGGYLEFSRLPAGLTLLNPYPTSPDGKGIVVGVDARSFREGRSKLLIYSYKKKGFLKIDLHKKIATVDTLGWAKDW